MCNRLHARTAKRGRIGILLAVSMVMLLTASSCGGSPTKGMKPSPDWSRGLMLGTNVVGSVSLVTDEVEGVHLAWPERRGSQVLIHYLKLNGQAQPVQDHILDLHATWPRSPRLVNGSGGQLHLLWGDRPSAGSDWKLWHTTLDSDGDLLDQPVQVSADGLNVTGYSLARDLFGGLYLLYEAENGESALYGLRLSHAGSAQGEQLVVASPASHPYLQVDRKGGLHAVWLAEGRLHYASSASGDLASLSASPVSEVKLHTGDSLHGPSLGVADGHVYILWSVLSRAGLVEGQEHLSFVSFPAGDPRPKEGQPIHLLPDEEPTYRAYQGRLAIQHLAPPAPLLLSSPNIGSAEPPQADLDALPVVLTFLQDYRLDQVMQIGMAVFEGGDFKGYQAASKSTTFSSDPIVATDSRGNLHLAWREGAKGDRVYYASTAPEVLAELDPLGFEGTLRALMQGSLEGVVGLAFFPFAFFWLVPGLIILGLVDLVSGRDSVTQVLPRLFLVVSLATYQLVKIVTLPTVLEYVPFSAWVEIPGALRSAMRLGVPAATLLFGMLAAFWVRYRRQSDSAMSFFFTMAGVDAILTLFIYGVNFLGAF